MRPGRLFILLAAGACTPASAGAPISGFGKSIDGDSLHVGDKEVRLFGIDAPEFDQTCQRASGEWSCGAAAAEQLSKLVTGKMVVCTSVGTDDHGRILGRCMAGATDINRTMVATGYAVAYRRYSSDYVSAEDSAKVNKRGLWAGKFQMPSDYRHAGDAPVPQRPKTTRRSQARPVVHSVQSAPSGGCAIKGNQGSNGWIYHLPGMPYYNQTRAEQMFCTEAEAQAAGYRRARVR